MPLVESHKTAVSLRLGQVVASKPLHEFDEHATPQYTQNPVDNEPAPESRLHSPSVRPLNAFVLVLGMLPSLSNGGWTQGVAVGKLTLGGKGNTCSEYYINAIHDPTGGVKDPGYKPAGPPGPFSHWPIIAWDSIYSPCYWNIDPG